MNTPVRRLALVLLLALAVIAVDLTYLQVVAGPRYRDDLRNPRLAASRTGDERGPIITREGVIVAESIPSPTSAQTFDRRYPQADLYAHPVGYASLLFGNTGLEEVREGDLRSREDLTISGIIDDLLGRDQGARGLRLTLSHPVQLEAESAMAGQAGAVVAVEPTTGEVLALYSSPSFDPTVLLGATPDPGDALASDPAQPLVNRGVGASFAPGSSFKVITAAAALESGLVNPETTYPDPVELELPGSTAVIRNGDRQACADGVEVDLDTAFRRSCNTVFGQVGMDVGAEALGAMADQFGFNDPIPFDLPTVTSVFPTEDLVGDPPATAQSAIGQRDVRATPLQMALVAATVANGGILMQPFLVSEEFDRDLNILDQVSPAELRRVVSPGTAASLSRMMEGAVVSGTGRAAAIADITVGGKTGTAEVPGESPHAWFIGYARDGERSVAVAVVVENGGEAGDRATGGSVAAPIARQVMQAWLATAN